MANGAMGRRARAQRHGGTSARKGRRMAVPACAPPHAGGRAPHPAAGVCARGRGGEGGGMNGMRGLSTRNSREFFYFLQARHDDLFFAELTAVEASCPKIGGELPLLPVHPRTASIRPA